MSFKPQILKADFANWNRTKLMPPTKGNKAESARLLEIGIATLYRKLDEYNIHQPY